MGILDVRFLTAEDERHLREFVQAQWPLHRTQLQPAIDAGLQKGSQHGLTWDMVDCKSRMLNISRTVSYTHLDVYKRQGWFDRHFGRLGLYQIVRPLIVGLVHGLRCV